MTLLHAAISSKANSKRNTAGRRSSTSSLLRNNNSSHNSSSSFTKLQQYENHLLTTSTPPSIATTTKKKSNYEQLIAAKELYKNEVAKLQSLSHNCNNNDVGTWPSNTSLNNTTTDTSFSTSSTNNKPFDEEEDAVVSTAYTIYKSETILQNNIHQEILETIDILDEVNASLLLADELNAVLDDDEVPNGVPIVDNSSSGSSRGSGSFNSGSGNGDLHLGGIESCLSDTDTAPINNRSPRKPSKSFTASTNNNNRNNHPLKKIDLTSMMAPHTNHSPNNSSDLLPEITKIIASAKDTPSKVKTHVTSTVDNTKKSIVNSVKSKRDEVVNGVKNSLSCGGSLKAVQGCTSTSIDDDELNAILNNTADNSEDVTPDTSMTEKSHLNKGSPTDVNNVHSNNKSTKEVNMYNIVKTSNLFTKCYTPGSESYDDMVYTSFGGVLPSTDEFSPDRSSNSGGVKESRGGVNGLGEQGMEEITTALFPNESHLVSVGNSVTAGHAVSGSSSVDNNTAASSSGSMAAADNSKALFPGDNAVVSGSLKSSTPPEGSPSNSVNSATKDLLSSINSVASSKATPVVSSTKKKKVVNRSLNHNLDGSADLLPEITAMINTVNETPRKIKNHVTAQVDKTKSNIHARVDKTKSALGMAKQNALNKVTCGNLETVNEVGQVAKFACSAGVLVKKGNGSSTDVNDSFSSLNEILEEEEMEPTTILKATPIKDQDSFTMEEVTSKQQFDARTTTTIAAQASNLQDEIYDYASSTSAPVKVIDGIFHVADPDGSSYPTEDSSGTTTTSGIIDKASDNSTAASFPFRKKGYYTIQATHPSSPDDTSIDISAYTESTRNTEVASVHLNPLCTRHANDCCFLNSMLEDEHQARVSRLLNLTERYLECNNKEEEKGVPPIVGVGPMINEDSPLKKEKEKQVLGNISEDKENKKEEAPTFSADWLNDSTVWDNVGTNVFSG